MGIGQDRGPESVPRGHPSQRATAHSRARTAWTWALIALLGLIPTRADGQSPSFGPLAGQEGSPIQRITYTAAHEEADALEAGSVLTSLWLGYSNIFEQDSSATYLLYMDMERLITTVAIRVGVADGLEFGGGLTLETTGGGVLDPLVSWWHTRLKVGNANRERFPPNDYGVRLEGAGDVVVLDAPARRVAPTDMRLFGKWRAWSSADDRRVLGVRAVVRIPLQDDLGGYARSDVAIMALGRASFTKWHIHGMLGGSTVRASADLGAMLHDRSYFGMFGVERSFGSTWSGLVQWELTSPLLHSFGDRELDWPSSNIVFGAAGRWGASWRWDVSFQEDLPADTPAVDFTLGLRLSRMF